MRAKPSKIKPLFLQCSIYFFILHLLLQFSDYFTLLKKEYKKMDENLLKTKIENILERY